MRFTHRLVAPLILLAAFITYPTHYAQAEITRIWLSHTTSEPSKVVVNWETATPGDSVVEYAVGDATATTVRVDESVTLHHVEIPISVRNTQVRYRVRSGSDSSAEATFKAYPTDELRVAIVADWQGRPNLDAILKDNVHLLLTAGDNILSLHQRCGAGVKDCTKPYSELIDAYPQLFRSVVFLPSLGNHDREIRQRGNQPPPEPVYDVEATAYRKFFALPGDEWKWSFTVPEIGVRFVSLDLNHIQDLGTTWQTCHPFAKDSEQFKWYEQQMRDTEPKFVVTLQNERNGSMRAQEKGEWHRLFSRGTIAVTGFGYFAERAKVDGFTYYNTALGTGAKYPDPKSQFFAATASYLFLRITPARMTAELKSLDGTTLDRQEFNPRGN